ncbi:hypothetical protein KAK05_01900 [Candidatus Parcubacteria bacterium]|nr:hypothetical protein [Candidatus Parcubacteria bacterium]
MRLIMLLIAVNMLVSFASANDSPYASINRMGSPEIIDSVVVNVCENLILSGERSYDPDGNVANHSWYDGDKLLSEKSILILRITDTATKNIKLVVTDNEGKTDSTTIVVYSHSTPDPKIRIMSSKDTLYQTDEFMVTFVVPKINDELQRLVLRWDYDIEVIQKIKKYRRVRKDTEEYQMTFKALKPGNTKISFSATNLCGKTIEKEIDVKILSSKAPKIEEIIIPDGIREEERFEISAEVSNCENGCEFFFKIFNLEYPDSKAISAFETEKIHLNLDQGLYQVNLIVRNKAGVSVFKSDSFEVPNTKNDLPIADASKTEKYAVIDTAFRLDGSASYDDGEISHVWFFLLNTKTDKYEPICDSNRKFCSYNFTRSGPQKLFLLVNDDTFPSLESKPYAFQVVVVASEERKEEIIKTGEIKKKKNTQQPKPVSHQPPSEEELKDRRNKELIRIYLPGFEFPIAFLVIIIMARKSRKGL